MKDEFLEMDDKVINILLTLKDDDMIVKMKNENALHIIKKSKHELDKEVGIAKIYKVICTNEWKEIIRM